MEKSMKWSQSFVVAWLQQQNEELTGKDMSENLAIILGRITGILVLSLTHGDEILLNLMLNQKKAEENNG
jgi:hypothetical protein